jgi:hypothetical protein
MNARVSLRALRLSALQDYHEMMVQQIAANLAQLEIIALRSMARRRS